MALRATTNELLVRQTNLPLVPIWTVMFEHVTRVDLASVRTFFKFGGVSGTGGVQLGYDAGFLGLAVRSEANTTLYSSTLLRVNEWHHIAATCNGGSGSGQFLVYIDGNLEVSQIGNDDALEEMVFFGWGAANSTENEDGAIENIKLWNRVLTIQEIRQERRQGYPVISSGINTCMPLRDVSELGRNYGGTNDPFLSGDVFTQELGMGTPWILPPKRQDFRISSSPNYAQRERGIRGLHRGLSVGVG